MANLPTCNIHCAVRDDAGLPVVGAVITAKLNQFEIYQGYVVPQLVQGTTGSDGTVILALWPNALGATESVYNVKIVSPNGKTLRTTVTVPNVSDANLHEIAELPTYDGKSDGQLIIDAAVAAVAPAVAAKLAAETAATNASSSATAAASSASSASTSATSAGTYATNAQNSATSAGSSATTATTKASEASASASTATTKASEASASASTATTKASEASSGATAAANSAASAVTSESNALASANSAASSASSASTSAATATTKAGEAATSATSASDSAAIATNAQTAATTAASTATSRASEATVSANNASASATAAASSASSASASASSATASAAAAATSATNAAASATNASTSATAAASSANSALTAPGTSATSTTSNAIGTGSKTFTIQTGKAYAVGQFVVIAQTSNPANFMVGQITAYNSGTGSLTVSVSTSSGSGTITDWTVALCAVPSAYAVEQADVGTAPNQIPLNQYLGSMAFQDSNSVNIAGGVITAQIRRRAPVTKTASFTVADTEQWLICNGTASITVTLPDVALNVGREIMLKTIAAFTVVSNASNVVPLAGGAAGTAILAATAGKYATLVSDGNNWIIVQAN